MHSTKFRLIISLLSVSFLAGAVSLLAGGQLLYRAVLHEANTRIRQDLNAAREIYLSHIRQVLMALEITLLGRGFQEAFDRGDRLWLVERLRRVAERANLDFAGITTSEGRTLCRLGPDSLAEVSVKVDNPLVSFVRENRAAVSGTVILSQEFLAAENPELAQRARIKLLPTPKAAPRAETEETAGMALAAAVPFFAGGQLLGVLYGGILLNRNQTIVDTVRETVFQQEIYQGQKVGTATLFFKDLRISTNVFTLEGKRAIGTCVSQEVRDKVLLRGEQWSGRAFVVNNWYMTAYEPIEDIFGERVGMLYVGVLEAKYVDLRRKALSIFILVTGIGMALAIGLGYALADRIMRPIQRLIKASTEVSQGNLTPKIGPVSRGEIGVLEKTFKEMLASLQERERWQRAEREIQLLQSEKQASIGRLAAGVAHEINNPLTGVLTFTHMLLRRREISDEVRADLETIARETDRVRKIVKGLLDFSRQTRLQCEPTEVNDLVRSTLALVENQALLRGIALEFEPGEGFPVCQLDRNQVQSALLNLILNALDATESGGEVTVSTALGTRSSEPGRQGVEIVVSDTGCGISPENLDKVFEPFFTTKEIGQGTGLGLAVSLGIVERHGGTIRVQSEVGRGSRFTIWLPLEVGNGKGEDIGRR